MDFSYIFIFFAYPLTISGDEVWVGGFETLAAGTHPDYGWWETGFFNTIFEWCGALKFDGSMAIVDTFTGATPLAIAKEGGWDAVTQVYSEKDMAIAKEGGWDAVTQVYSEKDMIIGAIPGSIGETAKPLLLLGGLRIVLSSVIGVALSGLLFNLWDASPLMTIPWYSHFFIGGAILGIFFMATDPVTASSTDKGKWIYGFLIGVIGMLIRVINPAYPEGWMLAILFMNSFAPLIDHFIISNHIKKRLKSE